MPSAFHIRIDDPREPEVAALIREHLDSVVLHSPPESVHALDLEGLSAPNVTFFSVWDETKLAGVGALKELNSSHGELKSMRTASTYLRRGVASALVGHLLSVARERGYRRVSLETGTMEGFAPARALYTRFGFKPCEPFADYFVDPNSVCMTLALSS